MRVIVIDLQDAGLLLDSSFQIDFLRRANGRQAQVKVLLEAGATLYSSVICYAEVCSGLRTHEEAEAFEFLKALMHLPVTLESAHAGGFLRRDLRRLGLTLHLPDILIAATALRHDLIVLTDNERDFRNTGVQLFALSDLN